MKRWRQFEHYCCALHKHEQGGHVWHWSNIPESVLIDSGFSSSTLELRNLRERNQGLIPEFGLDGIAMHADGTYHGIQAKLWRTILCAGNLGTFLSVVYGRMRRKNNASTGYLYHTGTLHHQLHTDVLLMTNIVANQIDYPAQPIHSPTYNGIRQSLEERAVQALVNAVLSPWQEPVQLNLPTGINSETITSRFLVAAFAHTETTIVVASHMHQGRRRVLKQLRQVMPHNKSTVSPNIISTTHGSMHNLFHLSAFFLINDAHLIDQLDPLPSRSLLISNEVKHNIPTLFTYSMDEAIADGLVCDYTIILPVEEQINVPHTMAAYGHYEAEFGLFLTSCMLETGSYRCAVYASSAEASSIASAFVECCREYHHMTSSFYIIDPNQTQGSRNSIIEQFNTDEHRVAILICTGAVQKTSSADSICITEGGMITKNALRYVCSTNAICNMQPSKMANAFIFSRDTDSRRKMLVSLLKGDSNALSKVRLISANYDTKTGTAARTKEQLANVLNTIRKDI